MKSNTVLLVSSLPPPHGGISTWTSKILEFGLLDETLLSLVNTRFLGQRKGRMNGLIESFRIMKIYGHFLHELVFNRPKLVHISCALSPLGVFRDLACAMTARLFRVPVVTHYRGNVSPNLFQHYCWGFSRLCFRKLVQMSAVNIVENQPSLHEMQHHYLHGQCDQVVLLPNFVDDAMFESVSKNNQNIDNARPRALFVGRLTRTKGILELLAAAKQLPMVDFYLIGEIQTDLADTLAKSPENVFLLGKLEPEFVFQEMSRSDFLLFPSYSEGFPLSVVEAMAVGLPVIATKVGAIPEMIQEGLGGFLVEPQQVDSLVNAIKHFVDNASLKLSMGQFNRQFCFDNYRYSIVVRQLMNIYDAMCQRI